MAACAFTLADIPALPLEWDRHGVTFVDVSCGLPACCLAPLRYIHNAGPNRRVYLRNTACLRRPPPSCLFFDFTTA